MSLPDWIPESVQKSLLGFWSCPGRSLESWERYVEESVPGGMAAVGRTRTISGLYSRGPVTGRFVPMWNNIARVVLDDGTDECGSFEQRSGVPVMTLDMWRESARKLFGPDPQNWKFRCPSCGNEQSTASVMALDASLKCDDVQRWILCCCQGRYIGGGCKWALGGFLKIHKLEVEFPDGSLQPVFEFAGKAMP